MRILLDILHPAHVHFFRNAIGLLAAGGHEVVVTARDKDLTLDLLDRYGVRYECLSKEAKSRQGLIAELGRRNLRLLGIVRRSRPDVMASIGGSSTAPVGFLTRTRNLIFYDTENATLSNLLSYPFATAVVTPDCYRKRVLGRHVTYRGYHELAYLHPSRFSPDPNVLRQSGVDPEQPYSVVRFVSWQALHDVGVQGFPLEQKRKLVETLENLGRVFITSEAPLPEDLDHCRMKVAPDKIHHLLAFARLLIGESATMASESVILGTPAIYVDPVGRGYTDEQERRYGMCFNYRPAQSDAAIGRAAEVLRADLKNDAGFKARVAKMLSEKINVTDFVVRTLLEAPRRRQAA